MSFVFGFLTAWVILSAILWASEEFSFLGIDILCKDSIFICLTLPVALLLLAICVVIKYMKVLFYAVKSRIRTAKR